MLVLVGFVCRCWHRCCRRFRRRFRRAAAGHGCVYEPSVQIAKNEQHHPRNQRMDLPQDKPHLLLL